MAAIKESPSDVSLAGAGLYRKLDGLARDPEVLELFQHLFQQRALLATQTVIAQGVYPANH